MAVMSSAGGEYGKPCVFGFAICVRASIKCGGKILPLFSARRRMPHAALALKKNLWGTWLSKISDNEHSTAALGHSEIAAVKHAPRNPIPAFDHENAEDFRKVSSLVGRKKSGNIFHDKPTGSQFAQDARKLVKESSALSGEPGAQSCDRDILAGNSRRNAIDGLEVSLANMGNIGESMNGWPMVSQHSSAKFITFHLPFDLESTPFET